MVFHQEDFVHVHRALHASERIVLEAFFSDSRVGATPEQVAEWTQQLVDAIAQHLAEGVLVEVQQGHEGREGGLLFAPPVHLLECAVECVGVTTVHVVDDPSQPFSLAAHALHAAHATHAIYATYTADGVDVFDYVFDDDDGAW